MPYRQAWLFVVALITAAIFAFWRSYFGSLATASAGFHLHGITASLWLLLLLAQSWTPHNGQLVLHRRLGLATFVAVPLFAAGAAGVLHSMATATRAGDPFYGLWGARLAAIDILAFGAVLYAAGMALRHRRSVRLHAGYMLSTALPLVSPILGRVINRTIPPLMIRGPDDFPLFGWGAQLGNLVAGFVALWLWRRDPRNGRPWAIALAVVMVQIIGFEALASSGTWSAAFNWIGTLPLPLLVSGGLVAGIAVTVLGWYAPAGPARLPPRRHPPDRPSSRP